MTTKSSIKFSELKEYKKKFEKGEICEVEFTVYFDNIPFQAQLKYEKNQVRFSYDREYKYKVYLIGKTKDKNEMSKLLEVYNEYPSRPYLIAELLFMRIQNEIQLKDNGELEYNFIFSQY